eukprot:GEMP01022736.1.p1 GENE.GEMP01022736.1~~GEMP01022736.1.p1  ORF type:complete len:495 (+),score=89.20 GEMP01022736.1:371-1855(+)
MARIPVSAIIVAVVLHPISAYAASASSCPVPSIDEEYRECLCGVGNRTYECLRAACAHIRDTSSESYVACENAVLSMPTGNFTISNFLFPKVKLSSNREDDEVVHDSMTRRRLVVPEKHVKAYNFLLEAPTCNPPIRFQDQCYNCYDQAAASTAAVSMCKKTGVRFYASVAYVTLCHPRIGNADLRCDFNDKGLVHAFNRITRFSLVHDQCLPEGSDSSPRHKPVTQKCPSKCADGQPFKKHMIVPPSEIHDFKMIRGEEAMKEQVYANGAIGACSEHSTDDYLKLDFRPDHGKDIIWKCVDGAKPKFLHCVTIYGWGEEAGTKYWNLLSSFGYNWGDKGHVRIRRGQNDCKIEQDSPFFLQFGTPTTTLTPPPDIYVQQQEADKDDDSGGAFFVAFMVLLGVFLCSCCIGAGVYGVYFWNKSDNPQGGRNVANQKPNTRLDTSPRAQQPPAARTQRKPPSRDGQSGGSSPKNKIKPPNGTLPVVRGSKQRAKQ